MKNKVKAEQLGVSLIVLGLVLLFIPFAVPMAIVQVGPVTISDISPKSAISIGVGSILLIIGIYLKYKKKIFK
jgi:hypothetical protein